MTNIAGYNPYRRYTFASYPKVAFKKSILENKILENDLKYKKVILNQGTNRRNTNYPHNYVHSINKNSMQNQTNFNKNLFCRVNYNKNLMKQTPSMHANNQNRNTIEIQTSIYLEELSTEFVKESIYCQTDAMLDRPPSPYYIPAKSGIDKETEIMPYDLFSFTEEIKPILEVLVGKTIEQALLEVMEEEELADLRQQICIFEEMRQCDLAEYQRLSERENRHLDEKKRLRERQLKQYTNDKELCEKVAIRAFTKAYLSNIIPTVFSLLSEHGYFYDVVERDVEVNFLPWLMESVFDELELDKTSRILLDGMIQEVVNQRNLNYQQLEVELPDINLNLEKSNIKNKIDKVMTEIGEEFVPYREEISSVKHIKTVIMESEKQTDEIEESKTTVFLDEDHFRSTNVVDEDDEGNSEFNIQT